MVVGLLFYRFRYALLGLIIFLVTSGLAQFLKRLIFSDQLRPYSKLGASYDIYLPDGVTPLLNHSFPSGHTTTAFAMAAFLVLILSRRIFWPFLLALAFLAGYSRIYLTHHFPIDVWTGSIIGTAGAYLLFWWLDEKFMGIFGDKSLRSK